MNIRGRIWLELVQSFHSKEYIDLYLSTQNQINKAINIVVYLSSLIGGIGGIAYSDHNLPIIGCSITLALKTFQDLIGFFLLNEDQRKQLQAQEKASVQYFDNIERLWLDFENGDLNFSQASEKFYTLRNEHYSLIEGIQKSISINYKCLSNKAEKATHNYFSNY